MPRVSLHNAPLGALRAFEMAARLGSFKAAAEALHVSPGAVSHQIQTLETYLGVALFERQNRAVQLTPQGRRLAAAAAPAFAELAHALAQAAQPERRPRNTLGLSVGPSLASRWLAPRLHRFQALHPDIALRLTASETLVDLAQDTRVDLALRYGPGPYPDLVAAPLWPGDALWPVCSPALRRQLPRELAAWRADCRVPLLRVNLPGAVDPEQEHDWAQWLALTGLDNPALQRAAHGGPLYSVTHLALEAAQAGRGMALSPEALVRDDLAAGSLVRVGSLSVADPNAHWLLGRRERVHLPRVCAFTQWLREELDRPA